MYWPELARLLCIGIVAILLAPTQVLAQLLLIDDFTSGTYQVAVYAGAPDLLELPPPTQGEVERLLRAVRHRVLRLNGHRRWFSG